MPDNTEIEAIVVLMTAADADEASRVAGMLVEQRLAACVQILPPMESIYRWQGRVKREREILLLAKTTKARFDELEAQVREIHSYETPEIVALSAVAVSSPYLTWLRESLSSPTVREGAPPVLTRGS